jgi:hypothetical protein
MTEDKYSNKYDGMYLQVLANQLFPFYIMNPLLKILKIKGLAYLSLELIYDLKG